jgi:DHA1 family tetracycline resistance protein-like MFS transporter
VHVIRPVNQRTASLWFILLTLFIDILGIGIVIPVLPELVLNFVDESTETAALYVGMIGASYALMQFIFAPILGALSDRFGRRPVILASLFGLGIDFLIQGLAPTIGWLFAGRIVAGVLGASFSTANAYIADISSPEDRARNFGLVGLMFGLGFICGPALGGLLGGVNLRLPFFISAVLALVNWLYGYFILPESLPPERRSDISWAKMNPLGTVDRLRAYPLVAGLALAFVFTSLAQRGLENVWILYMGYRFDWDERINGLVLGLVGLSAAIVQGGLVRPIVGRIGERRAILCGLFVSSLAFLGYGLAPEGWMIPVIILFGSLGGITSPAIQSIVAHQVDSREQGKIQGALTSLMSLTSIVAPLVFTAGLFSYFTSADAVISLPSAPFLVGSALFASALLIVRAVFRRFPPRAPDEPAA